jgi:hypothetical protein
VPYGPWRREAASSRPDGAQQVALCRNVFACLVREYPNNAATLRGGDGAPCTFPITSLSAFLSHAWGRRWWFFRDVTHDGREAVCVAICSHRQAELRASVCSQSPMMRARRSRSAGHVFGKHRGTKPLYASYAQSVSCDAGDDTRGGTGRTISAKRRKMPATCPKLPRPGSQARPARDGECLAYVGCTTQQEHRICAGYQRSTFTSQRAATPLSRTIHRTASRAAARGQSAALRSSACTRHVCEKSGLPSISKPRRKLSPTRGPCQGYSKVRLHIPFGLITIGSASA